MIGGDFFGKSMVRRNPVGDLSHVRVAAILGKPGDGGDPVAIGEAQQEFVRAHIDRDDPRRLDLVCVGGPAAQVHA